MTLLAVSIACLLTLVSCVTVGSSASRLLDVDRASVLLPPVDELILPDPPQRPGSTDPTRRVSVPGRIDASGETEVSERLQSFLDGVPDDSVIVFPAEATYRLAGPMRFEGREGIVMEGSGTRLLIEGCGTDASAFLLGRHEPSTDITIRGFEISGANDRAGTPDAYLPDCETQMGVLIYQSSGIHVEDVSVDRVNGDCFYVGSGTGGGWSEHVTIRDSSCSNTGRMGVAVVAGSDVLVEGVTFDRIGLFPFDIEPNHGEDGAENVHFIGNEVGRYTESDLFESFVLKTNGAGEEGSRVSGVVFANNRVTGGPLLMYVVDENRSQIIVAHNESVVSASGPIMRFANVDGLAVIGNEQPLESGPLVLVRGSNGVLVQ